MAARSHLRAVLIDSSGNLVGSQQVYIYRPGTTTAPIGSMYNAASGGSTVTNPRTSDSTGVVEVWLDTPQAVDFVYTDSSGSHTIRGAADVTAEAFLKPSLDNVDAGASIFPGLERYCAPWGNNANSGMSWGEAKKDVWGCYDIWDGANEHIVSVIHFWYGTAVDAANPTRGLWIAGFKDPHYASPLTGWRRQLVGGLRLVGHGGAGGAAGAKTPQAYLKAGDPNDRSKPAIWLSGTDAPHTFENILIQYPATGIRLGLTSDGDYYNAPGGDDNSSAAVFFDNVGVQLTQTAGNGPTVEMAYVFWIFFQNGSLTACTAPYTITAASITSGTTARFTTSVPHHYQVGDDVEVRAVTPTAYRGEWEITAVPTSTTFEADIGASPGAGTIFGEVGGITDDRRAVVLSHPPAVGGGTEPMSAGYTFFENMNFNNGGLKYVSRQEFSVGYHFAKNITVEGDGGVTASPPAIYLGAETRRGNLAVERCFYHNIELADTSTPHAGKPGGSCIWIDGRTSPQAVTAIASRITGPFVGAHTISLGDADLQKGVVGVAADGRIIGRNDGAWRGFSPQNIPFANLALADGAGWAAGSPAATQTTGQATPDGLTNGVLVTSASGLRSRQPYPQSANAIDVGDYIVCGILMKSGSSLGIYSDGAAADVSVTGAVFDISGSDQIPLFPHNTASLEWQWVTAVGVCTVDPGGTPDWRMRVFADPTHPGVFAYPLLVKIPAATAATLTDDEIREWSYYVTPFNQGAPAGSVATLLGQKLIAAGGLGVGNSASGSSLGTVVKKMQVFDAAGTSLGYVPIYNAIT